MQDFVEKENLMKQTKIDFRRLIEIFLDGFAAKCFFAATILAAFAFSEVWRSSAVAQIGSAIILAVTFFGGVVSFCVTAIRSNREKKDR